jgi:DNA-binding response OmpR family regulator
VSKRTILVVDDDPDVRLSLQVRLRAARYEVICAEDGVASIAETRKHRPDLILLDLSLPAGDGFRVLANLKANVSMSSIPVVVLSGRPSSTNRFRALKAGARAFLQKPVDNARLISIIGQALGDIPRIHSPVIYDLDHAAL